MRCKLYNINSKEAQGAEKKELSYSPQNWERYYQWLRQNQQEISKRLFELKNRYGLNEPEILSNILRVEPEIIEDIIKQSGVNK